MTTGNIVSGGPRASQFMGALAGATMLATVTSAAGYVLEVDSFLRLRLEVMKERPSRAKLQMATDEASAPSAGLNERLNALSALLDVALSELSMHLGVSVREQVQRDLRRLTALDYWEEGESLPSIQSFSGFLQFLSLRSDLTPPAIGISPTGNFLAAWRAGKDARVTLEFLSENSVRWVLLDARDKQADRPITGAGVVPIATVDRIIAPYGASAWMSA
jgi:hypothetical protein